MSEEIAFRHVARMFGEASAKANGGQLELVFLNGCCSEPLGKLLHERGVPVVVSLLAHAR